MYIRICACVCNIGSSRGVPIDTLRHTVFKYVCVFGYVGVYVYMCIHISESWPYVCGTSGTCQVFVKSTCQNMRSAQV